MPNVFWPIDGLTILVVLAWLVLIFCVVVGIHNSIAKRRITKVDNPDTILHNGVVYRRDPKPEFKPGVAKVPQPREEIELTEAEKKDVEFFKNVEDWRW